MLPIGKALAIFDIKPSPHFQGTISYIQAVKSVLPNWIQSPKLL